VTATTLPAQLNGTAPALAHVECWVFDLDNTLYPAHCDLFKQVDLRIGEYIADRFKIPTSRRAGSRNPISAATARRCAGS
jgi:hypothetical protein